MSDDDVVGIFGRAQHLVAENAVFGLDRRKAVVGRLPSVEVGDAVTDERNSASHGAPFRGRGATAAKNGLQKKRATKATLKSLLLSSSSSSRRASDSSTEDAGLHTALSGDGGRDRMFLGK